MPRALLQPGVPGDADPGQLGDLLAAQPRHPASAGRAAGGHAHVSWCQPGPRGAQERGQLGALGLPSAQILDGHAGVPVLGGLWPCLAALLPG